MPRVRTVEKYDAIVVGAAHVFAHVGYRRAMMEDVAAASGVALGTLYGYVDTKEELFELALRRSLGEPSPWLHDEARPRRSFEESVFELTRQRFRFETVMPELATAVESAPPDRPSDALHEWEEIAGSVYDVLDRYHLAIRMLDRSTAHWPELTTIYAEELRAPVVRALTRYLKSRCGSGVLRTPPDLPATTRLILEILATQAMHRRFTPGGSWADDETARTTAVDAVSAILAPSPAPRHGRGESARADRS